jgi:uncharacterized membrane protein
MYLPAMDQKRLPSIDVLRGGIMVLMALDHVGLMVGRFHSQEMWAGAWSRYQSALPFLTRFVTHFCAPGFFALMGAGISLFAASRMQAGWSSGRIARHVAVRGLLLVVVATLLEVPAFLIAIITGPSSPGSSPDFQIPGMTQPRWVFTVLFALGWSMVLTAIILRARTVVWALVAAAAILTTALTTPGAEQFAMDFSFARSVLMLSRWSHGVWSQYPIVPWFGIAALGVLFGRWLATNREAAFRALPWIGASAMVAAVVLRALGGFGNFRPPRDGSWIEFLNFIKYPPALVFTLFMLGGNALGLTLIERARLWTTRMGHVLEVFGQAPLAYYIAHLWLFAIVGAFFFRHGAGYGTVYLIWIGGLVPLYLFTKAYRDWQRKKPEGSVWKYF